MLFWLIKYKYNQNVSGEELIMKLPASNHVIWIISLIGLLIIMDTLTSWLLYNSGYDVSKDPSKTMLLVLTVLVPVLVQRWQQKSEEQELN